MTATREGMEKEERKGVDIHTTCGPLQLFSRSGAPMRSPVYLPVSQFHAAGRAHVAVPRTSILVPNHGPASWRVSLRAGQRERESESKRVIDLVRR